MLEKVDVADLRLGMYVHGFDGAWIEHPFWRTGFVLDDPGDLLEARQSAVEAVWIDVSKGMDVAEDTPRAAPRPAAPAQTTSGSTPN